MDAKRPRRHLRPEMFSDDRNMAPLGPSLVGYLSLFMQLGVLVLLASLAMLVRASLGRRVMDAWTLGLTANAAALAVLGWGVAGHAAGIVGNTVGLTLGYMLLEDAGVVAFVIAARMERSATWMNFGYGMAFGLAFLASAGVALGQALFLDAYRVHVAMLAGLFALAAIENARTRGRGLGAMIVTIVLALLAADYGHVPLLSLFGVHFSSTYLGVESYATIVLDIALGVAIVVHSTDAARESLKTQNAALAQAQRALREAAYTDALCGVPNRAAFLARLDSPPFSGAVVMLDLDGLKIINDRFGHALGDAALARAAHVLRRRVGEGGSVFRIGGDEFAVIWDGADVQVARNFMLQVEEDLGSVIERPSRIRISWGVAAFGPKTSIVDALAEADASLYDRRKVRRA